MSVHRLHRLALIGLACVIAWLLVRPAWAAAEDKPVAIVALGDSLVAGLGLPIDETFPAQLERALKVKGIAASIANAGVSGDTASAGAARLDWSVPDGTEAVIVELGGNDALRGIDPQATRAALEALLRRLKERGIPVLFCGMLAPPNMGTDYTGAFNAIFPELARSFDVVFYPFFLDGVAANAMLNQRDGIHPTAAGIATVVKGILPKVEELIARARAKRG